MPLVPRQKRHKEIENTNNDLTLKKTISKFTAHPIVYADNEVSVVQT